MFLFADVPPLAKMPQEPAFEAKLDAAVNKLVDSKEIVGLSVAIYDKDSIKLEKQYGFADLQRKTPVTSSTQFPIGSVSKQFTASCILLLQQEGKLSLSDKVGKYFPYLTRGSEVTIRDLLNQVSGYRDWYPLDYLDSRLTHSVSSESVQHDYGTRTLDFDPGQYFSYSNTNYLIAARIVEKVSGESFYNFVSERFLNPLKLDHTRDWVKQGSGIAESYSRFFGGPIEVAQKESYGWLLGAGQLISTPSDLCKWDIDLHSGKVVNDSSLAEMTSERKLMSGELSPYAMGLTWDPSHNLLYHGGGVSGSVSCNFTCPKRHSGFALTCNIDSGNLKSILMLLVLKIDPDYLREAATAKVPKVDPPVTIRAKDKASETARQFFSQMESGTLDRGNMTSEMNELLTPKRLQTFSALSKAWGAPTSVVVGSTSERGNMEVTQLIVNMPHHGPIGVTMFRTSEGKIAEFVFTSGV